MTPRFSPALLHRLEAVGRPLAGPATLRSLGDLVAARELLVHEMIDRRTADDDAQAEIAAVESGYETEIELLASRLRDAQIRVAQLEGLLLLQEPTGDGACPALERWRQHVLAARRCTPLERAAAWELTAWECERMGDRDHAHRARLAAAQIVRQASHASTHAA